MISRQVQKLSRPERPHLRPARHRALERMGMQVRQRRQQHIHALVPGTRAGTRFDRQDPAPLDPYAHLPGPSRRQ